MVDGDLGQGFIAVGFSKGSCGIVGVGARAIQGGGFSPLGPKIDRLSFYHFLTVRLWFSLGSMKHDQSQNFGLFAIETGCLKMESIFVIKNKAPSKLATLIESVTIDFQVHEGICKRVFEGICKRLALIIASLAVTTIVSTALLWYSLVKGKHHQTQRFANNGTVEPLRNRFMNVKSESASSLRDANVIPIKVRNAIYLSSSFHPSIPSAIHLYSLSIV